MPANILEPQLVETTVERTKQFLTCTKADAVKPVGEPAACPVDLLLVVDFSGSMAYEQLSERRMAAELVQQMSVAPPFTRVAMIKYSSPHRAVVVFHFDAYATADAVIAEINATQYTGGWTDTGGTLCAHCGAFSECTGSGAQRDGPGQRGEDRATRGRGEVDRGRDQRRTKSTGPGRGRRSPARASARRDAVRAGHRHEILGECDCASGDCRTADWRPTPRS